MTYPYTWSHHHGERLAFIREKAKLTQFQLAMLTGLHPTSIARLERSPAWDDVTLRSLMVVTGALDVTLGDLLGRVNRAQPSTSIEPQDALAKSDESGEAEGALGESDESASDPPTGHETNEATSR